MSGKPKPELMNPIFSEVVTALEVMHKVEAGDEISQEQFSEALSQIGTFVAISLRCLPHVSAQRLVRAATSVLVSAVSNKAEKG